MTLHTILTPEWIHEAKLIAAENPRLEGFVPSEGGLHPRILLLGEAPGDKEVKIGRPFMGPSGKELEHIFGADANHQRKKQARNRKG